MPVSPSNIAIEDEVTENSTNPVENRAIYEYLHSTFMDEAALKFGIAAIVSGNITRLGNDQVTSLSDYALYGQRSLAYVNIGNCTSIGRNALQNCTALISFFAPKVTSVGIGAFSGCSRLESLNFGGTSSGTIDCTALASCRLLSTIRFGGDSLWTITGSNATLRYMLQAGSIQSIAIYVPQSLLSDYQSSSMWGNNDPSLTSLFVGYTA